MSAMVFTPVEIDNRTDRDIEQRILRYLLTKQQGADIEDVIKYILRNSKKDLDEYTIKEIILGLIYDDEVELTQDRMLIAIR